MRNREMERGKEYRRGFRKDNNITLSRFCWMPGLVRTGKQPHLSSSHVLAGGPDDDCGHSAKAAHKKKRLTMMDKNSRQTIRNFVILFSAEIYRARTCPVGLFVGSAQTRRGLTLLRSTNHEALTTGQVWLDNLSFRHAEHWIRTSRADVPFM